MIAFVFAACAFQKIRTLINTHFQSRKVHENLVGTQPAREVFTRFFSSICSPSHIHMALRACPLAAPSRDARARSSSKMRGPRRAKKSRFKASQLPPGCLRCRHHRRVVTATRFRIRERLRIVCALPLLTVFKFVAIMRHSAANGKWNTAMRRSAPALRMIDDASRCVESGVEMCRRAARVDGANVAAMINGSTLR